jgi:hypothetical protein
VEAGWPYHAPAVNGTGLVLLYDRGPLPLFSEVFILKTLKVHCFYGFTEVLILKDLIAIICTKMVQISEVLQTKGLELLTGSKSKNASEVLAVR